MKTSSSIQEEIQNPNIPLPESPIKRALPKWAVIAIAVALVLLLGTGTLYLLGFKSMPPVSIVPTPTVTPSSPPISTAPPDSSTAPPCGIQACPTGYSCNMTHPGGTTPDPSRPGQVIVDESYGYCVKNTESVVCTQDVKQCDDGSWVGRKGPNCEFSDCPMEKSL